MDRQPIVPHSMDLHTMGLHRMDLHRMGVHTIHHAVVPHTMGLHHMGLHTKGLIPMEIITLHHLKDKPFPGKLEMLFYIYIILLLFVNAISRERLRNTGNIHHSEHLDSGSLC